jgi:YHS domain-containing protein
MTQRQISFSAFVAVFGLTLMFAFHSAVSNEDRAASHTAAQKDALAIFNSWIGEWRGTGQVRRGSTRGAWRENGEFVWKFGKETVGIEYKVKDPKHIKTSLISWDAKTKQFVMTAEFKDGAKLKYSGKFEKKILKLESNADDKGYVSRLTFRQLNEKRMLLLYERRKATQSIYQRLGEVGYTRAGTRLASSDSTGPVCIVSGGVGTMKVSYKGKTYYVCCTGCRDAFNDDPAGIIAEYQAKVAAKKNKL